MKTNTREPIYGIGIDTGGTYTDAVLFDLRDHQVVSASKRPTIHHRLERSIVQALDDIFPADKAQSVRKISFSTTLATNAIAEGRISKVGLIVIGQVKPFDAPVVLVRYVEGGHDHLGKEVLPLNVEQIVDAVQSFKGHVDAYAVAASCSIENPTHETVAAKAIELVDRKPVVCSSVVSSKSGIRERAATAVLHASLMPVIEGFVTQVNQVATERLLTADMRIIRGDAAADNLKQAVGPYRNPGPHRQIHLLSDHGRHTRKVHPLPSTGVFCLDGKASTFWAFRQGLFLLGKIFYRSRQKKS